MAGATETGSIDTRLAVYGTLAPGRSNHAQVSMMKGSWCKGAVRGHLYAEGWGAAEGYPGIVLDAAGPVVDVLLFESDELPQHWDRLDEFEGEGYRREPVSVTMDDAARLAFIYVLAGERDGRA